MIMSIMGTEQPEAWYDGGKLATTAVKVVENNYCNQPVRDKRLGNKLL